MFHKYRASNFRERVNEHGEIVTNQKSLILEKNVAS